MVLLRILKQFKNGIKEYFENTTVHGFRYILVARTHVCKLFWVVSILVTVSLCFLLIGQSLKEASDNPIMTTTEEVEVDQLPLPTISVLAPKELDPNMYHRTLLNMVDACNPELELKNLPMFASVHKLIPIINEVIRNATAASLEKYGAMAHYFLPEDLFDKGSDFGVFASLSKAFPGPVGSYIEVVNTEVDSHFMVNNISAIMDKIAKKHNIDRITQSQVDEVLFRQWMIASSPIRFRWWNRIECSERSVKYLLIKLFWFC